MKKKSSCFSGIKNTEQISYIVVWQLPRVNSKTIEYFIVNLKPFNNKCFGKVDIDYKHNTGEIIQNNIDERFGIKSSECKFIRVGSIK